MEIELRQDQINSIMNLGDGKILCGGVGSGKSRTSLAYYFLRVCGGSLPVNGKGEVKMMARPRDLYIITTAMKRDKHEWDDELVPFGLSQNQEESFCGVKVVIDSWQNIKKYVGVTNAFFIFDEQKLSGYGAWARSFLKITKVNKWILLSATPGDVWMDYLVVFIANGFFKHKTDFVKKHVIYRPNITFPVVDRYIGEDRLDHYRSQILVKMDYHHDVTVHHEYLLCNYDHKEYKQLMTERADPETGEPFDNISALLYRVRRTVNADPSRYEKVKMLVEKYKKVIVFYNFTYELEILRKLGDDLGVQVAEWNGQMHQSIPYGESWVFLVQYNAGAEGWNCIRTNVTIFYSQNYSYKIMSQSAGRIDRFNSPYKELNYYHLTSKAPIDRAIEKALDNKKTFNEAAFMAESAQ